MEAALKKKISMTKKKMQDEGKKQKAKFGAKKAMVSQNLKTKDL